MGKDLIAEPSMNAPSYVVGGFLITMQCGNDLAYKRHQRNVNSRDTNNREISPNISRALEVGQARLHGMNVH